MTNEMLGEQSTLLQGHLKSEAALLLEIFCQIYHGVDPKELLAAKKPVNASGSQSR